MKKSIILLIVIVLAVVSLASCQFSLKHEHILDEEWTSNELTHHKNVTCTWNMCKFDIVTYEHVDEDLNNVCDICAYEGLRAWSDVAQVVLDYEQGLRDELDKLMANNPEYNYYYHPVDVVYCTFILSDNAPVSDIVAKYDMNNLFASAEVHVYSSIEMITVAFDRNNFTEDMHRKIKQISESEALVENLHINMKRYWHKSYMPKIEYYTDYETVLKYEPAPYAVSTDNSRDIIIKTKEEYDAYLDELLESWVALDYLMAEYNIKTINAARDKYDEAFFEENALILTRMITRGSGSIKLTVNNLYISENKVYVVIRTDIPSIGTDDMQYAFYAFVVDKDDVVNVNEVITLE